LLCLDALWSKHTVYRAVTAITICLVATVITTLMVEVSVSTDETNEGQGCTKCIETSTRLQNYKAQCTRLAVLNQQVSRKTITNIGIHFSCKATVAVFMNIQFATKRHKREP